MNDNTTLVQQSIDAGIRFAELYAQDPNSTACEEALTEYRNLRRELPQEGPFNSRQGSYDAYLATQGLLA